MYSRIPSPPPRRMPSGGQPSYVRPRPPRPDVRVPFNYSGNAFPPRGLDGDDVTALSPHAPSHTVEEPLMLPRSQEISAEEAPSQETPSLPEHPSVLNLGHFPFGHGFGLEELLLLGLIFFLLKEGENQSERGDLDETVILLAFLLFCG